MNKYFFLSVILLFTACSEKNEHYYYTHPDVLQEALKSCANKNYTDSQCSNLKKIALHVNNLAFELQTNPQKFGIDIMKMQNQLSGDKTNSAQAVSQHKEKDSTLQQHLDYRLAVVKWLESPGK